MFGGGRGRNQFEPTKSSLLRQRSLLLIVSSLLLTTTSSLLATPPQLSTNHDFSENLNPVPARHPLPRAGSPFDLGRSGYGWVSDQGKWLSSY